MKRHLPEILLHALFWFLSYWMLVQTFSFESVEIQEDNGLRQEVYTKITTMTPFFAISLLVKMVLVYVNAFRIFPAYFKRKNHYYLSLQILLLFSLCIILELLLLYLFSQLTESDTIDYFFSMGRLNLMFYLFYFGLSVAYALGRNYLTNEKIKQQLMAEKLESELDFLKSQINPHFLFNTLNNLFAIAERKNNPELSKGIAELSNLMRYMLYDGKAELVPLEKEIRLLESIIEMHQLRIDEGDDVLISMNIEGDTSNKTIAPLILVPFVENAFKYGIDLKRNSIIKIDILSKEKKLNFTISNTKHPNKDAGIKEHSGIGLKNVKRRLELIYPHKHFLNIEENENSFKVDLMIHL